MSLGLFPIRRLLSPTYGTLESMEQLKTRKRADYAFILEYRTRWVDNDMYSHMNNSMYNILYDSIINTYLIEHCGLRPSSSDQYGLIVHSQNDYFASISFPAVAELAMRVNKLGKSSVTYEIALFEKGVDKVCSVGEVVHVFVDRKTAKPSTNGMNDKLRRGLERIMVNREQSKL